MKGTIERRQFRRAELDLSVVIRSLEQKEGTPPTTVTAQVKNIGLAGVYCHLTSPCPFAPGERVISSVCIPATQARFFPFTRIGGHGWVVRVDEVSPGRRAGESTTDQLLLGLAVAFAPDVTALASIDL